jgi:hypothetical protein
MGYIADKRSLQTAFIGPVVAMVLSSAIHFYGLRFAPAVGTDKDRQTGAPETSAG